jgi:hypothetical protein
MSMQALPGSALKVIETEFFFQLLMGLLAFSVLGGKANNSAGLGYQPTSNAKSSMP